MSNPNLFSRRGKFILPVKLIQDTDLEDLFKTVIVVRCEHIFLDHSFHYHAVSKHFDVVEDYCMAPVYTALFENNTFTGWKKVEQIV